MEVPNAPIADVLRASTVQVGSGVQVEKKKTKEEEDIDALLADLDALDTKKVRAPRPIVVWFVDVCDGFCGHSKRRSLQRHRRRRRKRRARRNEKCFPV